MAYPNNSFENDQLEVDQYGGAPAGNVDSNAWTFVTGLVRSIAKVVLGNIRVSYSSSCAVVQEAVALGDVIAIDVSKDATDPTTQKTIPYVGKYSTITTAGGTPKVLGVVTVAAAVQAKAQYANGGLLSPDITGLTSMTGGATLAVDATTSKLRAWAVGEDVLGYTTPGGCAFLEYMGRISS